MTKETKVLFATITVFRHLELLQKEKDPSRRAMRKTFAFATMYGSNTAGDMDAEILMPAYLVEQSDLDGTRLPLQVSFQGA